MSSLEHLKQDGGNYVTVDGYPFDGAKRAEHERLERQSAAMLGIMHDRLVHAPVQNPRRILEIGCGTGATIIRLAEQYPEAHVIGVDPHPVPPIHEKPSNARYLLGRFEDLFEEGHADLQPASFDYVFARWMVCTVTDWPAYLKRCYALLAPGGWLEMHEGANVEFFSAKSADKRIDDDWSWNKAIVAGCRRKGFEFDIGKKLATYFSKYTGLVDIDSRYYPLTTTPWPEKPETDLCTRYMQESGVATVRGMTKMLVNGTDGIEGNELEEMLEEAERTQSNPAIKGVHWRFYTVWGQRT
ncbi:S-adenosyl-L-methionine-dependent methyltransferase [Polychaeton citri CBS 116435]|uniref:S-adenosyl-L-methionine-dependent methyltransferase n=1 Tax=Polychaeton citri CBS 116435 TaxID=1314669 RepID=A0A9P4UNX9_9PEZI|nr:S-adenosyl-L-methionine-dependent methyltransferase [Polychaeton citri CBS 116435]